MDGDDDITLEPPAAHDLPAILELLGRAELPTVGVPENLGGFVVARRDNQVIACAGVEMHGADGLLRSVAVAPDVRGRGIAAALVRRLVADCARRGMAGLYLLTTTAPDYFTRLGFARCARGEAPEAIQSTWEFRSGCPDTAVALRRYIAAPRTT